MAPEPWGFPYSNWIVRTARRWGKYSGDPRYPVPSPFWLFTPKWAFDHFKKWSGRYGSLRMELLEFLLEESWKEL
jgi:hypothetical protein